MIERIDGLALKNMFIAAAVTIDGYKEEINELNVFPVPDGDTGSNMSMTIASAMTELQKSEPKNVGEAAKIAAGALLRGARGNSGVILSLLFRGFAKSVKEKQTIGAKELGEAFREGVDTAYKAVMKPSEGTILTVSRLAADAALEAAEGEADIEEVLEKMLAAGKAALSETINQNPVLKKAGVIDAGGKGYVIIIDAMLGALQGRSIDISKANTAPVRDKADFSEFDNEEINFAFDTVFIVRKHTPGDMDLMPLRAYLDSIGDSIVIGEDDEAFKVHVHTNIPGDAISEGQKYGVLELAKIENMRLQHDDLAAGRAAHTADELSDEAEYSAENAAPEKPIGVVSVCAGEGLQAIFKELGADGVISGGQTMNPSTEDILKEINRTPAETVFVLPNNKNIILAAEQCVGMTDKNVVVIPTSSVPQGVSAMLAMDMYNDVDELKNAMNESIGAVHTISLTYAARNSSFDGTEINEGDYLAMLENKLLSASPELDKVMEDIILALSGFEPDLISVYYGENVDEGEAEKVAAAIGERIPEAEVGVLNGGQPVYYFIISAENG